MAVLCEEVDYKWNVVGMTEVISDSLNPEWIQTFDVTYRFHEKNKFKIAIFSVAEGSRKEVLSNHKYIGEIVFELH